MRLPSFPQSARIDVLCDVSLERTRQDEKWGEQNHPTGTGIAFKGEADSARSACEQAFAAGYGTWRHILDEEVQEAFACSDYDELRAELIQVAAVAVSWIEALDRNRA